MAKVNPVQAQKFLGGLDYPASKQDLVEHAEQQGADQDVLDVLRRISDREYDGPNAVSEEISEAQ
jgi:hypothetical protein